MKPDIRTKSLSALGDFLKINGEKSYRARQVYDWLWKTGVREFGSMTNLSAGIRETLATHFSFPAANRDMEQESGDGTVKMAFRLNDGLRIEGVLIPSAGRTTA